MLLTLLEFLQGSIYVYINKMLPEGQINKIYVNKVLVQTASSFSSQNVSETHGTGNRLGSGTFGKYVLPRCAASITQSDPLGNLSGMRDPSFARSSPPSDHHPQQS